MMPIDNTNNPNRTDEPDRRQESRRRVKSAMKALALEYPVEYEDLRRDPDIQQRLAEEREMALRE